MLEEQAHHHIQENIQDRVDLLKRTWQKAEPLKIIRFVKGTMSLRDSVVAK